MEMNTGSNSGKFFFLAAHTSKTAERVRERSDNGKDNACSVLSVSTTEEEEIMREKIYTSGQLQDRA
jgi:hypothetical protein